MEHPDLLFKLLNQSDWAESQPFVDLFLSSSYAELLRQAVDSLNHSALFISAIHGVGHIERTLCHGAMGAQSEGLNRADTQILLAACSYHDVGRLNDSEDLEHGQRASLRLPELTGLTGQPLYLAQAAVECHSRPDAALESVLHSYPIEDMTRARTLAQLMKDADGLDRVRVWDLDPKYLRREASRQRAGFAKELFFRYQEATNGAFVPDFVTKWKGIDPEEIAHQRQKEHIK